MHWKGAQFCVCMFLDSTEKSLCILKFCGNDQRKYRTKEERRKRPCSGIRLLCTKCTVWPRNDVAYVQFFCNSCAAFKLAFCEFVSGNIGQFKI